MTESLKVGRWAPANISVFSLIICVGISLSWHALEVSSFKISVRMSPLFIVKKDKENLECLLAYYSYSDYAGMAPLFYNTFQNRITDIASKRITRARSRTAETSKMEHVVIIVKGWKPLTIITKRSILDVAAVLDPPLITVGIFCSISITDNDRKKGIQNFSSIIVTHNNLVFYLLTILSFCLLILLFSTKKA